VTAGNNRGEEARRPLFATGEVVSDYGLLFAYWQRAGSRAGDSVLTNEDFEELRRLALEGVRLDVMIERLMARFRPRIVVQAAVEAVRDYYGAELPPREAVDHVARLLAGWLIEAGTQWNIIRLRKR